MILEGAQQVYPVSFLSPLASLPPPKPRLRIKPGRITLEKVCSSLLLLFRNKLVSVPPELISFLQLAVDFRIDVLFTYTIICRV